MRVLKTDVDGRATFLVHPDDSQAKFSFAPGVVTPLSEARDGVVRLKDCIRVLDGFGSSLEVILPKLRHGYVVPNSEVGAVARTGKSGSLFPFAQRGMFSQCHRDRRQTERGRPSGAEA